MKIGRPAKTTFDFTLRFSQQLRPARHRGLSIHPLQYRPEEQFTFSRPKADLENDAHVPKGMICQRTQIVACGWSAERLLYALNVEFVQAGLEQSTAQGTQPRVPHSPSPSCFHH